MKLVAHDLLWCTGPFENLAKALFPKSARVRLFTFIPKHGLSRGAAHTLSHALRRRGERTLRKSQSEGEGWTQRAKNKQIRCVRSVMDAKEKHRTRRHTDGGGQRRCCSCWLCASSRA